MMRGGNLNAACCSILTVLVIATSTTTAAVTMSSENSDSITGSKFPVVPDETSQNLKVWADRVRMVVILCCWKRILLIVPL